MNVVLMGVSGCGKTTLGKAMAKATGGSFRDGDDFHSRHNKAKMAAGFALDDSDRESWLEAIRIFLAQRPDNPNNPPLFLACSALKRCYRTTLRNGDPNLRFLFLHGNTSLLQRRLESRPAHFMPASLLQSQLDTLEFPRNAITIDIQQPTHNQVQTALKALNLIQPE